MQILKNRILIKENLENTTSKGIIVASSIDFNTPREEVVIEAGNDTKWVKKGDKVMYLPRDGFTFRRDDTNYRILSEDNIIAIV